MLAWNESLSLGIPAFDADHRALIDLANTIQECAEAGGGDRFGALLEELLAASRAHFAAEEAFLRASGFPNADAHSAGHAELLGQLQTFLRSALASGENAVIVARYVETWLEYHVIEEDREVAEIVLGPGAGRSKDRRPRLPLRLLSRLKLRWRVALVALLPMAVVTALCAALATERLRAADAMAASARQVEAVVDSGRLVHELQFERGLSIAFLTRAESVTEADLKGQYRRVDAELARLGRTPLTGQLPNAAALLGALRQKVQVGSASAHDLMLDYTAIIGSILTVIHRSADAEATAHVALDARAFVQLAVLKEMAGRERAAGLLILDADDRRPADFRAFMEAVNGQRFALDQIERDNRSDLARLGAGASSLARLDGPLIGLRDALMDLGADGGAAPVEAAQWLAATSARMDYLQRIQDLAAAHISEEARAQAARYQIESATLLALAVVVVGVVAAATLAIGASVVLPLTALKGAMHALADGNRLIEVPFRQLPDEIGAMAKTVEYFRRRLIHADLMAAEDRLEGSEQTRAVADTLPGLVLEFRADSEGVVRCTFAGRQISQYAPRGEEDCLGVAVEDVARLVAPPDAAARVADAIRSACLGGRAVDEELQFRDSQRLRWMRLMATPRRRVDGTAMVTVLALDISRAREAEAARAEAASKLHRFYRIQGLNQIASGLGHEVNNLLQPIMGFADLAAMELPPEHPVQGRLRLIVEAGQRAVSVIGQALALGRGESVGVAPVRLSDLASDTLDILEPLAPAHIALDRRLAADDPAVLANATEMQQVLTNLCTNAIHAMDTTGGTLTVTTALDGGFVRLSVSDTGCGMSKEMVEQVFNPFFTTKGPGKGTGLGLALVHTIVSAYGGEVRLNSVPGVGTTVDVFIPVHEDRSAMAELSA